MATPQDRQRIKAFQAWLSHIGGIMPAHDATGIALRTIQRMNVGKQPPPPALLERLAGEVALVKPDLANRLLRAAQPAGDANHA